MDQKNFVKPRGKKKRLIPGRKNSIKEADMVKLHGAFTK